MQSIRTGIIIHVLWYGHEPKRLRFHNKGLDISVSEMSTVFMMEIHFEWDDAKSGENKRKHGVSFEEAQTVFLDENAPRFSDPDHSVDEDRFF